MKAKIEVIGTLNSKSFVGCQNMAPQYRGLSPDLIATYGALGCNSDKASFEFDQEIYSENNVLTKAIRAGHGSVADQSAIVFSIKDIPRYMTMFLCQFVYSSHLQQSLRHVKVSDDAFEIPVEMKFPSYKEISSDFIKVQKDAFELYNKMCSEGIPCEDARYTLPLSTYTNIQTLVNMRELTNMYHCARDTGIDKIAIYMANLIGKASKMHWLVTACIDGEDNSMSDTFSYYPSPNIFEKNQSLGIKDIFCDLEGRNVFLYSNDIHVAYIDQMKKCMSLRNTVEDAFKGDRFAKSVLSHYHYTAVTKMSLSTYHQSIRQRTWNQCADSLIYTLKNERQSFYVPRSIKNSTFAIEYASQQSKMIEMSQRLLENEEHKQFFINVLPHSLEIYNVLHLNAWNMIHAIGKRSCQTAQTEIREISKEIINQLQSVDPDLFEFTGPQCDRLGYCPEIRCCGKSKKKGE